MTTTDTTTSSTTTSTVGVGTLLDDAVWAADQVGLVITDPDHYTDKQAAKASSEVVELVEKAAVAALRRVRLSNERRVVAAKATHRARRAARLASKAAVSRFHDGRKVVFDDDCGLMWTEVVREVQSSVRAMQESWITG